MKYIAKQPAPELQDANFMWDEFYNYDGRLWSVVTWASHGRHNYEYATDSFAKAYEIIHEFTEWDEHNMNIFLDETVYNYLWYTYAKDVCAVRGENAPEWKDVREKAKRAIRDYCQACDINRADEIDAAADLLSAVTGIRFIVREIRGSCQGDYAHLVIPKDECSDAIKDEIEARYFNTGDEWRIENEDGDYLYAYTWAFEDEDKVKQIKEQCDIADDDTVELYEFDGWEKHAKYKKVL